MKRTLTLIASIVGVLAFAPVIASAQVTVSNTGPGSTVTVTDSSSCSIDVNNVTDITVNNNNNQNTGSGNANNNNNTGGGSSSTGGSTSNNSVTIDFSVNNGTAGTTAAGDDCVFQTASEPTTVSVPTNPTTPTGGAGAGQVEGATTSVAALPDTGVEDVLPVIGVVAAAIASFAAVSRFATNVAFKK